MSNFVTVMWLACGLFFIRPVEVVLLILLIDGSISPIILVVICDYIIDLITTLSSI